MQSGPYKVEHSSEREAGGESVPRLRSPGWKRGAKRNAILSSARLLAEQGQLGVDRHARVLARTSELPELPDAARLPCLTTAIPQAATTIAAAVEMFTVQAPSPPVPHVSSRSSVE